MTREHRCVTKWLALVLLAAACMAAVTWRSKWSAPGARPAAIARSTAPNDKPTKRAAHSVASAPRSASEQASAPVAALVSRSGASEGEVSGRVVDAAGGPVPFALVSARSPSGGAPCAVLAGEDGAFRIGVPAGEHDLTARAEAFSTALRRVSAPAAGVILELGPSSTIRGRVVSAETGEALAGVLVRAAPAREPAAGAEPARESAQEVTSDASGTFDIGGLRGGRRYEVLAASAEWQSEPHLIELDVAGMSGELLLAARPASVLSGRVLRDGWPCTSGEVRARRSPSGESVERIARDGAVRFASLAPGHYAIDVHCEQALPQRETLELPRGAHEREWRVQAGLSVRGSVVDARGRPLPNAKVAVRPRGELSDRQLGLCSSDLNGRFSCGGLSPGEYDAIVTDPMDAAAEAVPLVLDGGSVPELALRARPFGSIRVVFDAGPTSARVFARGPAAFPIEARRDEDGFMLERLPLGKYEVYVDQPSASGAARTVELAADAELITIELSAPARQVIAGFVLDEDGAPLPDSWVGASPSDPLAQNGPANEPEVLTDERGAFRLDAVAGGVYHLRAGHALGTAERLRVAAGSSDVVLRLTPEESSGQLAQQ